MNTPTTETSTAMTDYDEMQELRARCAPIWSLKQASEAADAAARKALWAFECSVMPERIALGRALDQARTASEDAYRAWLKGSGDACWGARDGGDD